jgi:hypothetical protein
VSGFLSLVFLQPAKRKGVKRRISNDFFIGNFVLLS